MDPSEAAAVVCGAGARGPSASSDEQHEMAHLLFLRLDAATLFRVLPKRRAVVDEEATAPPRSPTATPTAGGGHAGAILIISLPRLPLLSFRF